VADLFAETPCEYYQLGGHKGGRYVSNQDTTIAEAALLRWTESS
jgi:hypothetical protein